MTINAEHSVSVIAPAKRKKVKYTNCEKSDETKNYKQRAVKRVHCRKMLRVHFSALIPLAA